MASVSLVTPPRRLAAPKVAMRPGSNHHQYSSSGRGLPVHSSYNSNIPTPTALPYRAPVTLLQKGIELFVSHVHFPLSGKVKVVIIETGYRMEASKNFRLADLHACICLHSFMNCEHEKVAIWSLIKCTAQEQNVGLQQRHKGTTNCGESSSKAGHNEVDRQNDEQRVPREVPVKVPRPKFVESSRAAALEQSSRWKDTTASLVFGQNKMEQIQLPVLWNKTSAESKTFLEAESILHYLSNFFRCSIRNRIGAAYVRCSTFCFVNQESKCIAPRLDRSCK